jgi:hypothetical protein
MNDILTEEIELGLHDFTTSEEESIAQMVYDALMEKGIFCDSYSWSVNVEYVPRSNDDEASS